MGDERERYQQKRRKQLEKLAGLKNNITKDDIKLFYEFKPFRDRANREMEGN